MSLKLEFIQQATQPGANIAAICRAFSISRQAGHKWLRRYRENGFDGLDDKSRRPTKTPFATAEDVVMAVLDARESHPRWGPKKLRDMLLPRFKKQTPSRATVARILKRFGQIRQRRARAPLSIIERAPTVLAKSSNDVWTVDFKGWWRSRDGARCEPLTVRDAFSRFVLCAKIVEATTIEHVRAEFESLFRRWGLPAAIQCDNGEPFVSVQSRGGLTRLSAWWVSLGIRIVRSRPGCPQDNGGHERMHRDIRADVQSVQQADRSSTQRALDRWRKEFNHVRPHEALGGKTPGERYRPSTRRSLRLPKFAYPTEWALKKVYAPNGAIFINNEMRHLGRPLVGQYVALEPLSERQVRIWFHDLDLGELQLSPHNRQIDTICVRRLKSSSRKRAA